MNLEKLIKGGLWFLLFSVLSKVIAFFNKIYLTRNLTVEEYGLFISMFSLFGLVLTFTSLGLNSSIVKFIPHYKVKKEYGKIKSVIVSVFQFEFIMRLCVYFILLCLSPLLSKYYFKIDVISEFRLFAILILIELVYRNLKPIFKSFKKTFIMGLMDFLLPAFYGLFFFVLFGFMNGIYVPIISYLISTTLVGIIFIIVGLKVFNIFKYKSIQKSEIFKKMIVFGIPLVIANTGGIFVSYFDTIMLTSFSTLENVGIYNIALSSALLLSFVFNAISITLIPMVSELNSGKKYNEIKEGLNKLNKYSLLFLLPIVFFGILLSKWALTFFYGIEYVSGYYPLCILLIGMIFVILNNNNIRVLIGTGNTKSIAKVTWISAAVNVVLNIPFILMWGMIGAAISTSISYVSQYLLTKKQIKNIGI